MKRKLIKYTKFFISVALIAGLIAPSYAALSASDGSAFVTKAEFDSALADFNSRLTTFEAGINSKIDSQVTSYLDRNGIWSGKEISYEGADRDASGWYWFHKWLELWNYCGATYSDKSDIEFKTEMKGTTGSIAGGCVYLGKTNKAGLLYLNIEWAGNKDKTIADRFYVGGSSSGGSTNMLLYSYTGIGKYTDNTFYKNWGSKSYCGTYSAPRVVDVKTSALIGSCAIGSGQTACWYGTPTQVCMFMVNSGDDVYFEITAYIMLGSLGSSAKIFSSSSWGGDDAGAHDDSARPHIRLVEAKVY